LYCDTPKSCSSRPRPDAFANEVAGLLNTGVYVVGKLGMEQSPAGKNRQSDHVEPAFTSDEIRGHRHFTDFELLKLKLPPEGF
jgi:hypothetical protein